MLFSRSFGAIFAVGALAACGGDDNGEKPADAGGDASADAGCTTTQYMGEIIDWNATTNDFCGVYNATVTVNGQPSITAKTAPNGRFTLCLGAQQSPVTVDITPPTAASECKSSIGKYAMPGALTLQPSLIASNQAASVRFISESELTQQFMDIGEDYLPNTGHLVVHIVGTPARVQVSGLAVINCAPIIQFNGTKWERVETSAAPGADVYFPDCPLMDNTNAPVTATVSLMGSQAQPVMVSVAANKFTYVTIVNP